MNKLVKYIILSLFAFFLLITKCYSLDYDINSYHIDVIVNENNRLDITETIVANFKSARHGIYRNIPYYNTIIREDGTSETNRVKIYNIEVDNDYSIKKKSKYINIQIGDANKLVTGLNKYTIKYSYELGNDKNNNYDELYFNLIGTEWETYINNITFSITMPKEFDATKLGFTHGKYGSSSTDGINYTIDGNIITGSYTNKLNINEGLTVRLELPEGYFIKDSILNHILELLIYTIPIILVIYAYIIWNKYGKDDTVIDIVEFYPPEGLNSLDIAYINKGNVNNNDVVSLLIYLANKGYLKIDDKKSKGIKFTITKIKDYDGNNDDERQFFTGLFSKSTSVTNKDLEEKFYTTINSIIIKNNIRNKKLIFDSNASKKRIKLYIMFLICTLFSIIIPLIGYKEYTLILYILPIYFISTLVIGLCSSLVYDYNNKKSNIFIGLTICFIGLTILSIYGISIVGYDIVLKDIVYFIGFIISIFSSLLVYLFYIIVIKRTEYGTKMLGRVNGFKNFLETAEKEKLELLVEENPMYFYDILPYTYVLGISNKWIKKFEDIAMIPPSWYEYNDDFEIRRMCNNLNRTILTVNRTMTSVPQSSSSSTSSGGGFSGGGFSGGGSGGGGGGAW